MAHSEVTVIDESEAAGELTLGDIPQGSWVFYRGKLALLATVPGGHTYLIDPAAGRWVDCNDAHGCELADVQIVFRRKR